MALVACAACCIKLNFKYSIKGVKKKKIKTQNIDAVAMTIRGSFLLLFPCYGLNTVLYF